MGTGIGKITETEMNAKGVCAAPDILSGTTSENKSIFDRMVRELVAPTINDALVVLDELHDAETAAALAAQKSAAEALVSETNAKTSETNAAASETAAEAAKNTVETRANTFEQVTLPAAQAAAETAQESAQTTAEERAVVVAAVEEFQETSLPEAKEAAENAAESALHAEQQAAVSGWMMFYEDENGHLIMDKTDSTEVTMSVNQNGDLVLTDDEGGTPEEAGIIDFTAYMETVVALSAQTAANNANSATNATTAAQKAESARASAATAQTSATNAATSAANAATSEANAQTSAENAATSETNAATSAENAAASATTATQKAVNAATSAANAAVSQTNAAASAASSASSKTNAESSAANAATSAENAAASATTATQQATIATQKAAQAVEASDGMTLKQDAANALTHTVAAVNAANIADVSPLPHKLRFTQYGQCVQGGTPTTDAPVAITGKAAGASVYGKNLFDATTLYEVVINLENNPVSRIGRILPLPCGTYSLSIECQCEAALRVEDYIYVCRMAEDGSCDGWTYLAMPNETVNRVSILPQGERLVIYQGTRKSDITHYTVQVEVGDEATAFEPCMEQKLTVTDAQGNPVKLYGIGDVKDTLVGNGDGTGKLTRRIGHIASYNGETISTAYLSTTGALTTGAEVFYVLGTPTTETVTLTGDLTANAPTTTWLSDAVSDVTYNRDAVKVIQHLQEQLDALTNAVAAMSVTEEGTT